MRCHIFVGPTAYGLDVSPDRNADVRLYGPAARGDMGSIRSRCEDGDSVALVDGRFGDVPAVGHWEILELLDAGIRVWGLSSIGAIRAAELRAYGMLAFGLVANAFIENPDLPDDEVTLLHAPYPPYRPLTEPLVHLRQALSVLEQGRHISPASASRVAGKLEATWFGRRTWSQLALLLEAEGCSRQHVQAARQKVSKFPAKTRDFRSFLTELPWKEIP